MVGRQSFETAALGYRDAAYSLAFWLVRNRADAEDVVQEAYLNAFRAQATFAGGEMKPWLLTIVRNVAYRVLNRRVANRNVISLQEAFPGRAADTSAALASRDASAEALLVGESERELVLAALAELQPIFREVMILRELEELPYKTIADITGVPIGTVMSRLSRARRDLRDLIRAAMDKDDKNAM